MSKAPTLDSATDRPVRRAYASAATRLPVFFVGIVAIIGAFAVPLTTLFRFASDSTLYSYIPLVPFVTAYLLYLRRSRFPATRTSTPLLAAIAAGGAVASLLTVWVAPYRAFDRATHLTLTTSAFLLAALAVIALCLGREFLRTFTFPLTFLAFMIPLPTAWLNQIELLLQHGSAAVAGTLFRLLETPVFYQDLVFQLPGISLRVARECSGIHSTVALLMVSLVGGHLFLRSRLHASVLAASIVPIALARNGLRIATIGQLCVWEGPHMVDSRIHHQGGPVFFALSLVPLLLLLVWMMRREKTRAAAA